MRTLLKRPDLLPDAGITKEDLALFGEIIDERGSVIENINIA